MIVLDTNVMSEAMKPEPNPAVQGWLDEQTPETLYLTSVTAAELLFGIATLPDGRRKQSLTVTVEGLLDMFEGRILAFNAPAARRYADLAVAARTAGKGFPTPDGYIAAIAAAHGFAVATRDASAFKAAGISVINPWEAGSR